MGAVPAALDSDAPDGPVLSWVCPGVTPAGAVRRFASLPASAVPERAATGSDLTVAVNRTHIAVRNTYFEVHHPLQGGGGFPDRVEFRLSGTVEDKLVFLDRLYRTATRRGYSAANDPAAVARITFQSPVRVVVETQAGYRDGTGCSRVERRAYPIPGSTGPSWPRPLRRLESVPAGLSVGTPPTSSSTTFRRRARMNSKMRRCGSCSATPRTASPVWRSRICLARPPGLSTRVLTRRPSGGSSCGSLVEGSRMTRRTRRGRKPPSCSIIAAPRRRRRNGRTIRLWC